LIRGHFHATRSHLIYVVKGFKTYNVKGPTSIIQKIMIAMFGIGHLIGQIILKHDLLIVKILVP